MFESINWLQILVGAAVVMIPMVAGYAAVLWRQHSAAIEKKIEAEVGETWWTLLESVARTLIASAEQTTGIDTNEEKKAFVQAKVEELAAAWNIPVTPEQIDAIIEGVYKLWYKESSYGYLMKVSE